MQNRSGKNMTQNGECFMQHTCRVKIHTKNCVGFSNNVGVVGSFRKE